MMKSTQDWAPMTEKSIAYAGAHFILIKPFSEPEHEETVILEEIKPHWIGTVSSWWRWSQLRTDLTATFPSNAQMRVRDFRNLRLAAHAWHIKYVACGLFYYLRTQPCARHGALTHITIFHLDGSKTQALLIPKFCFLTKNKHSNASRDFVKMDWNGNGGKIGWEDVDGGESMCSMKNWMHSGGGNRFIFLIMCQHHLCLRFWETGFPESGSIRLALAGSQHSSC